MPGPDRPCLGQFFLVDQILDDAGQGLGVFLENLLGVLPAVLGQEVTGSVLVKSLAQLRVVLRVQV